MKFFLISDSTDAMIGMRLAGIEAVKVSDAAHAEAAFEKAAADDTIALLLVTPGVAALCPQTVMRLRQGNRPLLAVIPDGSQGGERQDSITEYIRDAIGIKI